jgi:hypothetical protein
MHALREYSIDSDSAYDGNAYTITAILDDMCLGLYAVHITKPSHDGGSSEFHLNCLKFWVISGSLETFREAVNAYRNARDFARLVRRELIDKANSKVASALVENYAATTQAPVGSFRFMALGGP